MLFVTVEQLTVAVKTSKQLQKKVEISKESNQSKEAFLI